MKDINRDTITIRYKDTGKIKSLKWGSEFTASEKSIPVTSLRFPYDSIQVTRTYDDTKGLWKTAYSFRGLKTRYYLVARTYQIIRKLI